MVASGRQLGACVDAIDRAAYFDAHERPVEAAKAYEEAIRKNCASLETYLNLAALYFVCQYGGYAAHHRLAEEFLNQAWNRFGQVLNEAEAKFGPDSEIDFWRHYFRFMSVRSRRS
jgi:esterase/lipase superfamily enzyme